MTNVDQLRALEAAIVAGDWDHKIAWKSFGIGKASRAERAFSGSLDAAKALHDALVPGCNQYSIVTDPTCICVKVAWWPDGLSGNRELHGEGWDEANAARAWLLAIIRALIAGGRE